MDTLVIIGNCQAQFLEGLFTAAGSPLKVQPVAPSYMLGEADRSTVQRHMDEAALVFVQRTADDFNPEWLRSRVIAERCKGKTWIWPNLYFDGYFPKTRYVYLPQIGKLQSPLEDYHLTPVLEAYKAGLSAEQAAAKLREDPCGIADPFGESHAQLRLREEGCTVTISDYVAAMVSQTKCFYTPNHPHTFLLAEMARRLAEAAQLPFDAARAGKFSYRLDKIDIPVFDWVMRRQGLGFDNPDRYKGLSVQSIQGATAILGDVMFYDTQALVRKFYEIYNAAL